MLVVIGHEGEHLIFKNDIGLQHRLVPVDHLPEFIGPQNCMGKFAGNDPFRFAISRIAAHVAPPRMLLYGDHRSMIAARQSPEDTRLPTTVASRLPGCGKNASRPSQNVTLAAI